ncbi:SCP-like protein [Oesophagostomum dentatum]|uniref:SCP-like protein n=1 Tax=Oesophagostomum dentatum TaxID=61180 RepID=A0A0B1SYD1_OESDE|nr:SCP-like protein [Oesophagostomum dentatum]
MPRYRSRVARGLEPDKEGGNAPKAAKMLKMLYDCDIEKSAMRHAQKCVFQHSYDNEDLGENLYAITAPNYDKAKTAEKACQSWWDELKQPGVGQDNILTGEVFDRGVGHYTQMAWEKSYKLGCAVQHCPRMTYVVCQYGPGGNDINELIYTKGQPCSGCPGKCIKAEGLCMAP